MATEHGLPDVSDLLRDLNDARKSVAYGDIELPELDPEDTAMEIETFIERSRITTARPSLEGTRRPN
ncbi:MAG: hypothetical protein OXH52_20020 [Gammaproteobacteria bacterium]|nr:hypothetical protein [Gammaproteobacteria bacterium]